MEVMNGRHGNKCSVCNPVGGHDGFESLFDEYVYCAHDGKPCDRSLYIDWSRYVEGLKTEDEILCGLSYNEWMREKYGVSINESEAK